MLRLLNKVAIVMLRRRTSTMGNSCNGTRANSIVPSLMATPLTVAGLAAARDAANAATFFELTGNEHDQQLVMLHH
jgi:hypothetical protein